MGGIINYLVIKLSITGESAKTGREVDIMSLLCSIFKLVFLCRPDIKNEANKI